jgi:DNA-binding transcriptional LysR family regulator
MDLELRHLKVVCTIAEQGSVTKAASALGLAQPALTTQLQRIERLLGGALFERDRRGSRPTQLGELVLARARVVLPAVDGLRDEVARLASADPARRRVRIGSVGGPLLGGLVDRLTTAVPDVDLSTYTSFYADELAAMVVSGRLDVAHVGVCGDSAPPAPGLVWRTVAVEAVSVLLRSEHPLAGQPAVDLALLADADWAAAPGDGCFGECFAKACARAGFTPRRMYSTDATSAFDLVESGRAVALCKPTLRPVSGVVAVPLAGAPLRWRQLVGWHPDGTVAALGPRLVDWAQRTQSDAVQRCERYAAWLGANPEFVTV